MASNAGGSAQGTTAPSPTGPLGLQVAGIDQSTPLSRIDGMVGSVLALGGRAIRLDIAWQGVEWAPVIWSFDRFDHLVATATDRGLAVDFILDYNHPMYGGHWNELPRDLKAWGPLRLEGGRTIRWTCPFLRRTRQTIQTSIATTTTPNATCGYFERTFLRVKEADRAAIVAMSSLSLDLRTRILAADLRARPTIFRCGQSARVQRLALRVGWRSLSGTTPRSRSGRRRSGAPATDEASQASFFREVIPALRAARRR